MNSSALASFGRVDDLFRGRAGAAESDVLEDRSAKEHGVLQNIADLVAQGLKLVVAHVWPSMMTVPAMRIVEAWDQADDGGLSAAGRADDPDELAGLNVEADVGEDGLAGSYPKATCSKSISPLRFRGSSASSGLRDDVVGIENCADAFDANGSLGDGVRGGGEILDGLEELGEIGEVDGEFADGHDCRQGSGTRRAIARPRCTEATVMVTTGESSDFTLRALKARR